MGSLTKGTSVAGPRPCTGAPGTPTCSAPPPLHFVTFAPLTLQTHHMCLCLPETVRPSFVPESAFLSSKALQSLMEKFSLQIWVGLVGTGLQVPQMLKGVAIWPSNSSPGIQPRETRRYIHKTSQEVQAIQVPIMHKCACKMRSTCKTECYWAVKRDETRTIRS